MSMEPDSVSSPVIALGPSAGPGSASHVVSSPASSSTACAAPTGEKQHILVNVAAVFGQEMATTEFRIPSTTALSKLLLLWCREYGCAPGDVRFSLGDGSDPVGHELPLETTAAELQAWATSLDYATAAGVTVQATPEPGAVKRWPASPPAPGKGHRLVGSPVASALGPAALRAAQLLSVRVVAESQPSAGRTPCDDETQFWMPPELPLSRLMEEWCRNHSIEQSDVRFFLNGQELLPTDTLLQWGFNAREGSGSVGRAAIQISAEPSSLDAANRGKPSLTPVNATSEARIARACSSQASAGKGRDRVAIRTEAVGGLVARLQGLCQKHAPGSMKCYMKRGAPLFKIMDIWCKDNGLPRQEITFRLASGYAVQPEDTAEKIGCQADDQVTFYVELRATNPTQDRRVVVKVSDESNPGEEGLTFKMNPERSFESLMDKWCEVHQRALKDVCFLLEDGCAALRPYDSPLGVCPSLAGGNASTLHIRVVPVQKGPEDETSVRQNRPAAVASPGKAGQNANGSSQLADNRVFIVIDTESAGVKQKLKFRMNPTVSLGKVIDAWCKSNGVPLEAVRFSMTDGSRELTPRDTPQSCNWRAENGVLHISAVVNRPTKELAASAASVPEASHRAAAPVAPAAEKAASQSPRAASSSAAGSAYAAALAAASASAASSAAPEPSAGSPPTASSVAEKVTVEVVAELADEPSLTELQMKPTTEFEKMMKAWCSKHGQELDNIVFWTFCSNAGGAESKREVMPHESPSVLGWSAARGVLTMQVTQKSKKDRISSDRAAEQTSSSAKTHAEAQKNDTHSAVAKKVVEDEKIKAQVVAVGPEGEVIDEFTMRVTTPFEKMMQAWCKHNEISLDEARFEFNGRVLRSADTPADLGWSAQKGVLVVKATPVEDEADDAGEEAAKEATATKASTSNERGPEPASTAEKISVQTQSSSSTGTAAATKPGDEEKIKVQVVALGPDGEVADEFMMRVTTPFEKMMQAWCQRNQISLEEARFDINGQALRPSETPADYGWSSQKGALVVKATPAEDEDDDAAGEEADKDVNGMNARESSAAKPQAAPANAPASASASSPVKQKDQKESVHVAEGVVAKKAVDDEKIKVQVAALGPDGLVTEEFMMRATTPFEKMMKAWCNKNEIPLEEACFDFNGRVLQPAETPVDFGWSSQKGALVINATPAGDEPDDDAGEEAGQDVSTVKEVTAAKAEPALAPRPAPAPAAVPVAAPALPAPTPTPAAESSSSTATSKDANLGTAEKTIAVPTPTLAAESSSSTAMSKDAKLGTAEKTIAAEAAPPPAKIMVQVLAEGENGPAELTFKMKPSTSFEKMMAKWCESFEIPLAEVCFKTADGRELRPDDTPDSCKWTSEKGNLVINAVPRETVSTANSIASAATPARTSESLASERAETSDANDAATPQPATSLGSATAVSSSATSPERATTPAAASPASTTAPRPATTPANTALAAKTALPAATPANAALPASSSTTALDHASAPAPAASSTAAAPEPASTTPSAAAASSTTAPEAESALGKAVPAASSTTTAPAASSTAPVSEPAATPATAGDASAAPPVKVNVKVIARCGEGNTVIDVKMKPASPFEKMMKAWCQHTGFALAEVKFLRAGKLIRPEDTPDGLKGFKPEDGDLVIEVEPRSGIAHAKAEKDPDELPSPAPARAPDEEEVKVVVIAASEAGEVAKVDFKMTSSAPFRKMMQAWCDHQGLSLDAVTFELRGLTLNPDDSPASRGWTAAQGAIEVSAFPKQEKVEEKDEAKEAKEIPKVASPPAPAAAKETSKVASTPAPAAAKEIPTVVSTPAPAAKVQVQVAASGPQGQNIVNVSMKAATCFQKMMDAWCKQNGILQDNVMFLLEDGRELKGTDSPQSCGAQGTLKIRAVGKTTVQAGGSSGSDEVAGTQPPAPAATEQKTTESAAAATAGTPPVEEMKVEISVHAVGEDGDFVQNVRMKASSPFSKVMTAFCKEVGIPLEEACFSYNSRELQPDDTPISLGWGPGGGTLVVHAKPRDTPHEASTEAAASRIESTATASSASADAPRPPEKVAVRIVALAADGEVTLEYQLAPSTEFGTIMKQWYEHHRLDAGSARFLLDGSAVRETDTPASLGRGNCQGHLRLVAEPRGDEEDSMKDPAPPAAAQQASEPHASPAVEAGGFSAPNATAEAAGAVEVKVVADGSDGRNILAFKMKLSTPFGKMMSRWCEHHGIQQDLAAFFHNNRELDPEETPQVLGWVPTKPGESVTIQAMPRGAAPSSTRTKEKGQKRKRGQGAPGDEPAPKRAASAYLLWSKERRPRLVEERPELKTSMQEQTKALSVEWRNLSEEARRPYEEEAARDKQRAESERAAYAARRPADASAATPGSSSTEPAEAAKAVAPEVASAACPAVEQLSDDAGIAMLVVAEGEDGLCEDRFKLKMSTAVEKMMAAWCNIHEIPAEEATFILGTCDAGAQGGFGQMQFALRKTDTAADLRRRFGAKVLADAGLTEDTPLVVKAVPNDGEEFEKALKAREAIEAAGAVSGSSSSSTAATSMASCPAPQSPPVPAKAAPKPARALKRQRSDTPAAKSSSSATPSAQRARSKHPRPPATSAAAENEDQAGSDCSGSASDGGEQQTQFRSARLREAQPKVSATATIIHHTPPSTQKRARKDVADPDAAMSPAGKPQPDSEYMSFEEYLKYDREQERLVAKARQERQKRLQVSGVANEDEEFQLAMAISLSMAGGSTTEAAEAAPAPGEAPPAAAAEVGTPAAVSVPAGEQL